MKTGIGNFTDTFLNYCIKEINKKQTRDKINSHIIDPIISDVNKRIFPYLLTYTLLIILILILILIILIYLVIFQNKNK
jgi:hypothetical protein